MDFAAAYGKTADAIQGLVDGVTPDQMDAQTPCKKWKVKDLLNHVVAGGHMFAGAAEGKPLPDMSGGLPDMLGDNVSAAYKQAAEGVKKAFSDPAAAERTAHLPIGDLPGPAAMSIAISDHVVHAWDLAKALGKNVDLPADIVELAKNTLGPALDNLRDGDTFADEQPAPDGASALDQLAAFTGRKP